MGIAFQVLILCFFVCTKIFGKYILIDTEDNAKAKEEQHKVSNAHGLMKNVS